MEEAPNLLTIGWREWVSLPDIDIQAIKAKIDTGARTSALHTHDYQIFSKDDTRWVRFHIHPLTSNHRLELECEARVVDTREVKDSGGHIEERPFILTTVHLGKISWAVEFSLTNRESMKFRMLLGRQALAGKFIVDSQSSYLIGKKPK